MACIRYDVLYIYTFDLYLKLYPAEVVTNGAFAAARRVGRWESIPKPPGARERIGIRKKMNRMIEY